jgi:hypothetical protein
MAVSTQQAVVQQALRASEGSTEYNAPKCVHSSYSTSELFVAATSCMQSSSMGYDVSLLLPDSAGVISCSCPAHLPCVCRLRISVSDFDILARLGDGSFSTVVLAKYKGDGQQYAVKIVNKTLILRNKVRI